jgi:Photosynthetic reaction centre cytochrome C subunit
MRVMAAYLVAFASSGTAVFAQPAPAQTAGERYKSVRMLREIPASQMIEVMSVIAGSLGVTCAHCHTAEWESDEKPMKEKAREMIRLTRTVDGAFGGGGTITCNTCHQGQAAPPRVADLEWAGWRRTPPTRSSAPLPTADSVFDRYLAALGGRERLAGTSARVAEGTVTRDNDRTPAASGTFVLRQALPRDARVETTFSYPPEAEAELIADFFRGRRLRELYPRAVVTGREALHGRGVVVVDATTASGREHRLYFDAGSGLLLRRYAEKAPPLGLLPESHDFNDYRDVGGLLEPFLIDWSRADYHVTFRLTTITHTPRP